MVDILVHNEAKRILLDSLTNLGNLQRSGAKEKRGRKWRRQDDKKAKKLGECAIGRS